MACKQENQKSGTKNKYEKKFGSAPHSEYEDPNQLKEGASNSKPDDQNRQAQYAQENRSDYEDRDFSTINIAQLTSYEDFSPDRRTTSSEEKRNDYKDRNFSTINIAQLTSYEDFSPDRRATSSEEKRKEYKDRDFSTINIAHLTSYEDFSPDRRATSSEDIREIDKILFERMTMLEKRMKTLENRQDAAKGVNSETKISEPKKAESKVKDTPTPDAIKPIKRKERTLQSLLDELDNCFMTGRKSKANFCLSEIKKLMTSSTRPKAAEVTEIADKYFDNSSYIKAAVLLSWAAELHVSDSDPDTAGHEISSCAYKYDQVIRHMKDIGGRMHTIAEDFGVNIILKMLGNLRDVTSVNAEVMFEYETWTLSNVGVSHSRLNHNLDSITYFREGMDLFERKYKSSAMEHYFYGQLLHNTGVAHSHLGNYAEAEKHFLDALKSYNASNDWEYEGQKGSEITKTEERLNLLRQRSKDK
ncbi:uncharacterized protein LOC144422135 [Styela clava]